MAKTLAGAGIHNVASLLTRYPRDWEDRGRFAPLKDWMRGPVSTTVTVLAHDWFGFGPMKTLKIHVEDETARATLVCFNRPFLEKQFPVGKSFRIWGRFYYKYGGLQSSAFETENLSSRGGQSAIVPVYPLSSGLHQNMLRRFIRSALDQYAPSLDNELPPEVMAGEGCLSKQEAVRNIHFPASMEVLEKARKTLIFEELFYLEVIVGRRALERRKNVPPPGPGTGSAAALTPLQKQFLDRLPFPLTPGQTQAIAVINADMSGPAPMARLLQGDVGSGKTLVAFFAALRALLPLQGRLGDKGPGRFNHADAGQHAGQIVIMAPTELLARQHAENAARLLEPLGIRPAYLTGNLKAAGRAQLLKALAAGEIDIVLGTHALFSKDVVYRNLTLAIIDEQHRFGVTQRQAILAKGRESLQRPGVPHLLMMSATPIPRTLALTVFGDLDVSVINGMPPGRKPVKTHLAKESNAWKVYDFVRKELETGAQAYFVYPLIGENGEAAGEDLEEKDSGGGLKDAVSMAEKLAKEIFPLYPAALIHSKIDDEEKRKTMEAFRRGEIRILAATSVVEVGVDVPNASCMVIHHAERFGLSALHQLRGRVGRGSGQAYCFLIYSEEDSRPALTGEGKQRLKVMLESNDGFVIAEEDLKLRGPGQIAGLEQSGYLKLGIADPVRDVDALVRSRSAAFAMLEADPGLLFPEHQCVAGVLSRAPPFTETGL
jgi:ATP-dependent DNA helicase RecG